jgi:hypothetical protein
MQVQQLGPEKLLSGTWQDGCLMLVMPGGADLPYCRQLNGHGNSLIRGAGPEYHCACYPDPCTRLPALLYIKALKICPNCCSRLCGGWWCLPGPVCWGLLCLLLCIFCAGHKVRLKANRNSLDKLPDHHFPSSCCSLGTHTLWFLVLVNLYFPDLKLTMLTLSIAGALLDAAAALQQAGGEGRP